MLSLDRILNPPKANYIEKLYINNSTIYLLYKFIIIYNYFSIFKLYRNFEQLNIYIRGIIKILVT